MKKLISVLLSFSLIFNVAGYGQTCDVSAVEVNQANQQGLEQDLCKDPKNISLMAALITVVTSLLKLLGYLCVGTLYYTWSVMSRFPSSVCELFAGTLSTENEELKKNISEQNKKLAGFEGIDNLLKLEKEEKEKLEKQMERCMNYGECKTAWEKAQREVPYEDRGDKI